MTNRIIDLSNLPAHLSAKGGLLEISLDKERSFSYSFDDLAAVVVSHPQVSFSQAALARLAGAGAVVVICNDKHMPVAMTMPIESHWYQAERFVRQAALAIPRKKRLWQKIVRAKISNQAALLVATNGSDSGLAELAKRVGSGDPANVEARAAKLYWPRLFNDKHFYRSNDEDPRNALLNYGYALLRATLARSICASGLHPSFGLHHANKLNAFPLADDLMEPYRPIVDARVVQICADESIPMDMSSPTKQALLAVLAARYRSEGEIRTLHDISARCAQSLAAAILNPKADFNIGLDGPFPVQEEG